jgi:hypothetical protein
MHPSGNHQLSLGNSLHMAEQPLTHSLLPNAPVLTG